jgi:hypothetical protein
MSKRKDRKYIPPPLPPPDPENYILVQGKEGPHWRRKRGTVTKATLNATLKKYADATSVASPAAKRIKEKLGEFLHGLDTARFVANVSARLKKVYVEKGTWDYSLLGNYDFQPDNPMGQILDTTYMVMPVKNTLLLVLNLDNHSVRAKNKLVSQFYFDFILLWGDPSKKNKLRIDSDTSSMYPFKKKFNTECRLSLDLPSKGPWMALLKVSCFEGKTLAHHPRHYGLKVVKAG